jgi:hypothetical protein
VEAGSSNLPTPTRKYLVAAHAAAKPARGFRSGKIVLRNEIKDAASDRGWLVIA